MKKLHFIGICGAGMAPLAQLSLAAGDQVAGSDSAPSAKSEHLAALGARVFTGHRKEQLDPATDLVIYSSAVTEENPERQRAAELGIPQLRRGEFLGEFSRRFKRVAAVSGSHGKSSITAMLTTILEECGAAPGALIGAARVSGDSAICGNGDIFVTEVDESDGTHVCVMPYLGIVPNIDGDHEWSVGGPEALKENFRTFGRNCRHLLIADTPELAEFFSFHPSVERCEQPISFAGFHGFMAQNAALAVKAAVLLGIEPRAAEEAVKKFAGIERRMRVLNNIGGRIFLEDYAHHPTEVRSSISLAGTLYPGKKIHVIFQPHRYARLERFFDEFVRELQKAARVTVTPVFAAWCETGKIGSADLCKHLPNARFRACPWEELAGEIKNETAEEVVLLLGAGDISELAELFRKS